MSLVVHPLILQPLIWCFLVAHPSYFPAVLFFVPLLVVQYQMSTTVGLIMCVFWFLDMDPATRRRRLVIRGSALVVVVSAWFFVRFRRMSRYRPSISYGPLSQRDQERAANLRFIYHSNDNNCVELLRMKRAPFSSFVTFLEPGVILGIVSTVMLKSKWHVLDGCRPQS